MKKHYDVVIIGSGLGGLVSAVILASEGYSVCVLEKNNQYGGNLQTFVRDKSIFDTGVHYIGGLEKGQNLYQLFNYLGIMQDLKLKKMDTAFDKITFDDDEKEYEHLQGHQNFRNRLLEDFPEEEKAITSYFEKINFTCKHFPLYTISSGESRLEGIDLLSLNIKEYLDNLTDNSRLKAVLTGSNLLYAGKECTPFFVHALSLNSFLNSAYKCINGGSQIAKLLLRKLKIHGGEFYKYQEVTEIQTKDKNVTGVVTKKGEQITGDIVISNIEPMHTLDMITGSTIRKSYINRIKSSESIISAFSLYIVFKPKTFRYFNHNIYHFKNHNDTFTAQNYNQENWPLNYMVSLNSKPKSSEWADNMTILTYMNYDEVKQWESTFNTKVSENERGKDYQEFKNRKTEIVLKELEKKYPDLRECIQSVHSSTPLSYRDYIGVNRGSMYGYVKDSSQPLRSFLSPKTKINNLFFTGQSVKLHGILGVTISAVATCAEILGKEYLISKINEANQ